MNFEITNGEDDTIKIKIEFIADTWDELRIFMELIDEEFGI